MADHHAGGKATAAACRGCRSGPRRVRRQASSCKPRDPDTAPQTLADDPLPRTGDGLHLAAQWQAEPEAQKRPCPRLARGGKSEQAHGRAATPHGTMGRPEVRLRPCDDVTAPGLGGQRAGADRSLDKGLAARRARQTISDRPASVSPPGGACHGSPTEISAKAPVWSEHDPAAPAAIRLQDPAPALGIGNAFADLPSVPSPSIHSACIRPGQPSPR